MQLQKLEENLGEKNNSNLLAIWRGGGVLSGVWGKTKLQTMENVSDDFSK